MKKYRKQERMKGKEEILRELKMREKLLERMKNDPSCPFSAYGYIETYISALKWVLGDEQNEDKFGRC